MEMNYLPGQMRHLHFKVVYGRWYNSSWVGRYIHRMKEIMMLCRRPNILFSIGDMSLLEVLPELEPRLS